MSKKAEYAAAGFLILLFLALCITSSVPKSATVDEFAHLPAGLYALKTRDFSLYSKTPPLGRMVECAPALLFHPQVDTRLERFPENSWRPWTYGSDLQRMNFQRYWMLLFSARAAVMLMGALVCFIVWRFAREGYGEYGGLLSLALCALSPTLIAHARLVTTDVPAALASIIFLLAMIRYFDRPGLAGAFVMAAAAGLSCLVKFSCLFWIPFALAAPPASAYLGMSARQDRPVTFIMLVHLALAGAVIWLVIIGGYLGKSIGPHKDMRFGSDLMRAAAPLVRMAPLPRDFIRGLDRQLFDAQAGEWKRGNYLLGQWYKGGKIHYYAVALSAKETIPHLLLFLVAVFLALLDRPKDRDEFIMLFSAGAFFVLASIFGALQIGVRYLMPVFPAVLIVCGKAGQAAFATPVAAHVSVKSPEEKRWRKTWRVARKVLLGIFLLWLLASHAVTWPHYLSYFNEAWGGPENGRNVLLDSNLDWGQDLPSLKRWMNKNGLEGIDLAYFGHDDPARHGISYTLPARDSDNRYIAISANLLMGKKYPMTFVPGEVHEHDPLWKEIIRYQGERPVAMPGWSILVFEKLEQ